MGVMNVQRILSASAKANREIIHITILSFSAELQRAGPVLPPKKTTWYEIQPARIHLLHLKINF